MKQVGLLIFVLKYKEGVPAPLRNTTLKRNVEQLLFADLNLILFQQKRNEVLNEIIYRPLTRNNNTTTLLF